MNYLDMLATVGIGNAHPGGFAATLKQLEVYPIPAGSRILEIGCGTGRTSCHLAQLGYEVTGIDLREDMIAKARKRAEHHNADVHFEIGNAARLHFAEGSFDAVIVESVSNFADTAAAVSEYNRVLKHGGKLYDREVIRLQEMPEEARHEVLSFYGLQSLFDAGKWEELLTAAGFCSVIIDGPHEFHEQFSDDYLNYPDPFQQVDPENLLNPDIWRLQGEYDDMMKRYQRYLGYALMIGSKTFP